jgi:hypothetical protein
VGHHEELDRVGDDLAGNQGGFHALGAHGDAVGDGDRVEFNGSAAGGADALLYLFREGAEMEIAGRDFRPGIGDGDQRAGEIGVGETGGLQHRAGGRAGNALLYFITVHVALASLFPRIAVNICARTSPFRGTSELCSSGIPRSHLQSLTERSLVASLCRDDNERRK